MEIHPGEPGQSGAESVVESDRRMAHEGCLKFDTTSELIKPQYAIQRLSELTKGRDTFITTEVGQHQMWAAQYFRL